MAGRLQEAQHKGLFMAVALNKETEVGAGRAGLGMAAASIAGALYFIAAFYLVYFGIPYPNDHGPERNGGKGDRGFPPIPLYRGTKIVEQPADLASLRDVEPDVSHCAALPSRPSEPRTRTGRSSAARP